MVSPPLTYPSNTPSLTHPLNYTGLLWRHFYGPEGPRAPPVLHMWPADKLGDIHKVTSNVGIWSCNGKAADCQSKEPVNMELEVVHPYSMPYSHTLP